MIDRLDSIFCFIVGNPGLEIVILPNELVFIFIGVPLISVLRNLSSFFSLFVSSIFNILLVSERYI